MKIFYQIINKLFNKKSTMNKVFYPLNDNERI